MMVGYKKLGMVLGAVVALTLLPAKADAQTFGFSPIFWSFEGSAGIALPLGDLADVADPGLTLGVGASYFLGPRIALRAEGSIDMYGAPSSAAVDPELMAWHFTGGIEYHIVNPTGPFMFNVDVGFGGVSFDTDPFTVVGVPTGGQTTTQFEKTYFAVKGGAQLGYNFAQHTPTGVPTVTIFASADFHYMFADDADTQLLGQFYGVSGFSSAFAIPITGGVRINIP